MNRTIRNSLRNVLGAFFAVCLACSFASCAGPGYVSATVGTGAVYDNDWGYYDEPYFDEYYTGYRGYRTAGYGTYDYYDDDDLLGVEVTGVL